jgi:hypothetical protein
MHYTEARGIPPSAAEAALAADHRSDLAQQPWAPGALEGAQTPVRPGAGGDPRARGPARKGGASDTFAEEREGQEERKGGASDAFRSGASDAFRR